MGDTRKATHLLISPGMLGAPGEQSFVSFGKISLGLGQQFQLTLGDYFKEYPMTQEITEQAIDLIGWINNHGMVWKIFDDAHKQVSKDQINRELILTYLIANLTQWTTHCTAFI